jgi:hypothetical protein
MLGAGRLGALGKGAHVGDGISQKHVGHVKISRCRRRAESERTSDFAMNVSNLRAGGSWSV